MDLNTYLFTTGITKKAFSRKVPCHLNTLNNWLSGRTFPGAHHIQLIEKATKKNVTYKDWMRELEFRKTISKENT